MIYYYLRTGALELNLGSYFTGYKVRSSNVCRYEINPVMLLLWKQTNGAFNNLTELGIIKVR